MLSPVAVVAQGSGDDLAAVLAKQENLTTYTNLFKVRLLVP